MLYANKKSGLFYRWIFLIIIFPFSILTAKDLSISLILNNNHSINGNFLNYKDHYILVDDNNTIFAVDSSIVSAIIYNNKVLSIDELLNFKRVIVDYPRYLNKVVVNQSNLDFVLNQFDQKNRLNSYEYLMFMGYPQNEEKKEIELYLDASKKLKRYGGVTLLGSGAQIFGLLLLGNTDKTSRIVGYGMVMGGTFATILSPIIVVEAGYILEDIAQIKIKKLIKDKKCE